MGLGSENETKSQDQIKDMNSHMIIRTKPKKTEQKDLKGKDVFKTVKKPNPYLERENRRWADNTKEWSITGQ